MRVGLVLGAGGVLGGAWLTGGLDALARETGWDPGSAEYVVGTSAGSVIGAFVAAGIPPWFMVAHSAGETFDGLAGPDGRPAADADRSGGGSFGLHRGLPLPIPGSVRLGMSALRNPLSHTPFQLLAGWLPTGLFSTDSIKDTVRRAVPERWVDHPNYWAVACDYTSGKRVPFGRLGSPPAELADAVAASCAIPGFFRPVRIGGRRYVDGGVCSASNLDLLAGLGLDLVICLNPLSSRDESAPADRITRAARRASGRRLGHEGKKLQSFGTAVALIQPSGSDHTAMGNNLMSPVRRQEVIQTARETVAAQLREPHLRELLADLPAGAPHAIARPSGPPATWPDLEWRAGRRPPFRISPDMATEEAMRA
jgi:NTE family protein